MWLIILFLIVLHSFWYLSKPGSYQGRCPFQCCGIFSKGIFKCYWQVLRFVLDEAVIGKSAVCTWKYPFTHATIYVHLYMYHTNYVLCVHLKISSYYYICLELMQTVCPKSLLEKVNEEKFSSSSAHYNNSYFWVVLILSPIKSAWNWPNIARSGRVSGKSSPRERKFSLCKSEDRVHEVAGSDYTFSFYF